MRAPLHVPVVLLCSVYRAFSCSLLFPGYRYPPPPPLYYMFYIVLLIIYPVGSPLFFQFSGAGAGFFPAGEARGWVASRAGSWVFWLLGFGVSSSSPPHVPEHPTSICDEGVFFFFFYIKSCGNGALLQEI